MKPENNPFYQVELFEKELAEFCGSQYCCLIDSFTNGLFLVFKYFKLKNEKIIFPRKTYVSPPMMALATENIVVFKDFDWEGIYQIEIPARPDIVLFDAAKRLKKGDYINNSIMIKSFHMKKHITSISGKGGAILTNDKKLYDWCIRARWEGRTPYSDYKNSNEDIEIIGYNFNPTCEQAIFLRRQLQTISENEQDLIEPNGYRNLDEFTIFKNCEIINA